MAKWRFIQYMTGMQSTQQDKKPQKHDLLDTHKSKI